MCSERQASGARQPGEAGFTLIETLIALFVFLFIGLGAAYGLARGVSGNIYDSDRQSVLNQTQALLDQANPATSLCNSTVTLTGVTAGSVHFTCVPVTVAVGAPAVNVTYQQVVAAAQWTTKHEQRSLTLIR